MARGPGLPALIALCLAADFFKMYWETWSMKKADSTARDRLYSPDLVPDTSVPGSLI